MTPFLQFILLLAIIIFAAKSAGYLATRIGQPSVLGELIIGLILGPSLINILHLPIFNEPLVEEMVHQLGEIGVLLLMFVAGLELHFSELARMSRVSAFAGSLGVLVPVLSGYGVGIAFGFTPNQAIFLGLALGATSVSISAQTLMELGVLRSRVGLGLLGSAVFDDILVILIFSTFLALSTGDQGLGAVVLLIIRMAVFLGISLLIGIKVLPVVVRKVSSLPVSQSVLALAVVVLFIYGFAAEVLGSMAAITGTFLAGLMFSRTGEKERLERGIHALAYGFFVPIFFVNIGLSVNARELDLNAFWLFAAISVIAIVGKLVGSGAGARLAGYSWREALQLGAGMVSRGEVGLILAAVGSEQGLVNSSEFSAIIGMVVVTTLITPPMLRALFAKPKEVAKVDLEPELEEEVT
jgi:Kef-type K+ transport system membrane component KefB